MPDDIAWGVQRNVAGFHLDPPTDINKKWKPCLSWLKGCLEQAIATYEFTDITLDSSVLHSTANLFLFRVGVLNSHHYPLHTPRHRCLHLIELVYKAFYKTSENRKHHWYLNTLSGRGSYHFNQYALDFNQGAMFQRKQDGERQATLQKSYYPWEVLLLLPAGVYQGSLPKQLATGDIQGKPVSIQHAPKCLSPRQGKCFKVGRTQFLSHCCLLAKKTGHLEPPTFTRESFLVSPSSSNVTPH